MQYTVHAGIYHVYVHVYVHVYILYGMKLTYVCQRADETMSGLHTGFFYGGGEI